MRDKPALSILIPWCERDELRLSLAASEPIFRTHDSEILILNCGGDPEHLRSLIMASGVTGVRQLDLSVPGFNKSLALNAGLAYTRADTVFILDADVVLFGPLPMEAIDEHSFVTIESAYECAPREVKQTRDDSAATSKRNAFLELTFRKGVKIRHQLGLRDTFENIRPGTGLLLAKTSDLLNIGGFNSDLETWGWEDDDVLIRLQHVLQRHRVQRGVALHLTHGDGQRFLRGSREKSNQRNFIRCCRNYNNGLFMGSYLADTAGIKVTETLVDVRAPELSRAAIGHPVLSAPMHCGSETGMMSERDRSTWPRSISALLLEAALMKSPIANCDVLQVGAASSRLADQLSSRCRHITLVARDELEEAIGATRSPNYHAVVCSSYSQSFCDLLPLRAYDVIIDPNLTSHACCERHLRTLMENYSSLLAPGGWLATPDPDLDGAARENCGRLTEIDLAGLAGQFGLRVWKTGAGICRMSRCETSS